MVNGTPVDARGGAIHDEVETVAAAQPGRDVRQHRKQKQATLARAARFSQTMARCAGRPDHPLRAG